MLQQYLMLFLAGLAAADGAAAELEVPRRLLLSAHRGGGRVYAPDNSLPNLEHAVQLGVPLAELDLRVTADGGLVLWHDGSAPRALFGLLGEGVLRWSEMDRAAIGRLRYSAEAGGRTWTDLAVLDADEVVRRFRERVGLHLDVKDTPVERVLKLIADHEIADRCIVMSDDLGTLAEVKRRRPEVVCEWTQNTLGRRQNDQGEWVPLDRDAQLQDFRDALGSANGLGVEMLCTKGLDAEKVALCRGYGVTVRPSASELAAGDGAAYLKMGVEWLLCDDPERVQKAAPALRGREAIAPGSTTVRSWLVASRKQTESWTLIGVNLIKEKQTAVAQEPLLRIGSPGAVRYRELDNAGHDKYTSLTPHGFVFHLRVRAPETQPWTDVFWPDVPVRRVLTGKADCRPEPTPDGFRFRLGTSTADPAKLTQQLPAEAGISFLVFHNDEARRAGYYATGQWPEKAIRAQLNYLFAARQALVRLGLTGEQRGFKEQFNLYGFETNFPRGHVDHPSHFHLMMNWEKWDDVQVTHYRLDEGGRITQNDYQCRDQHRRFGVGEACRLTLPDGRCVLELTITPDRNLELRRPGGRTVELRPDQTTGDSAVAVDVVEGGRRLASAVAEDNVRVGLLTVTFVHYDETPPRTVTERFRYDPDTAKEINQGAASAGVSGWSTTGL
jgi:glycerophosphoryl diester phosphodiesterase